MLDRQIFWKIQGTNNLFDIVHPFLDLLLMCGEMGCDEEEGCAEEGEGDGHGAFGAECGAGPHRDAGVFGQWAEPYQVAADEDRQVEGTCKMTMNKYIFKCFYSGR